MSHETLGPKLTLEQLGTILPEAAPSYVRIEAKNASTGYTYDFGFISEHPSGPFIRITTETRESFLTKGTEEQAQDALIELVHQTRRKSGGSLSIHPFYGAVWGTKLTPVAPGFCTDIVSLQDNLASIIYLTNAGEEYDQQLTNEALEIGTVVAIPGPMSERYLRYIQAAKANPNQADRDIAVTNGLGQRWDDEFKKLNRPEDDQPAMALTPNNIVRLMRDLEKDAGLSGLSVAKVFPEITNTN